MKNLFRNFIKKRFELTIKETYLVDTLKILEKNNLRYDCRLIVLDAWLVTVYIPETKRRPLLKQLKKEGITDIKTITKDSFGNLYYKEL